MLIFKIVPRAEWEAESGDYHGSAHDRADGFLHFSTGPQLPETLRRYYAGQDDLMLVATDADALGDRLKWEHSQSRDEDFPHLYGVLSCDTIKWVRSIARDADGKFVLPDDLYPLDGIAASSCRAVTQHGIAVAKYPRFGEFQRQPHFDAVEQRPALAECDRT
jgi:uncharacterized protein (DUF952 family)